MKGSRSKRAAVQRLWKKGNKRVTEGDLTIPWAVLEIGEREGSQGEESGDMPSEDEK